MEHVYVTILGVLAVGGTWLHLKLLGNPDRRHSAFTMLVRFVACLTSLGFGYLLGTNYL